MRRIRIARSVRFLGTLLASVMFLSAHAEGGDVPDQGTQETYCFKQALSEHSLRIFTENGFVVVPGQEYNDMNKAYENFRSKNQPILITTDSILHTTHLLFDRILRIMEENDLTIDLARLTRALLAASVEDYGSAHDEEVRKAACANIAFFSVAARLLKRMRLYPALLWMWWKMNFSLLKGMRG